MTDYQQGVLNFGEALDIILREKKKMTHSGWQGKKFIYLVPSSNFVVNRGPLNDVFENGTDIDYNDHIDIMLSDGTCEPYMPSQSEMTRIDWYPMPGPEHI